MDEALRALQERAKELECLYRVDELLRQGDLSLAQILQGLVRIIPPAWQYPAICRARASAAGVEAQSPGLRETPWTMEAPVPVDGVRVGRVEVFYDEETAKADLGPFLAEEETLLLAIAGRLGRYIEHQKLRRAFEELDSARDAKGPEPWRVILEFLRHTDESLLARISRKMINHLGWLGVDAAVKVLHQMSVEESPSEDAAADNQPLARLGKDPARERIEEAFRIASSVMSDDEIIAWLQKWIKEDKSRFMVTAIGDRAATLEEIGDAIRRYHHLGPEGVELSDAAQKGMRVSLIERFFTDQLEFITVAKQHLEIDDFYGLVQHIVSPPHARGKLGG